MNQTGMGLSPAPGASLAGLLGDPPLPQGVESGRESYRRLGRVSEGPALPTSGEPLTRNPCCRRFQLPTGTCWNRGLGHVVAARVASSCEGKLFPTNKRR